MAFRAATRDAVSINPSKTQRTHSFPNIRTGKNKPHWNTLFFPSQSITLSPSLYLPLSMSFYSIHVSLLHIFTCPAVPLKARVKPELLHVLLLHKMSTRHLYSLSFFITTPCKLNCHIPFLPREKNQPKDSHIDTDMNVRAHTNARTHTHWKYCIVAQKDETHTCRVYTMKDVAHTVRLKQSAALPRTLSQAWNSLFLPFVSLWLFHSSEKPSPCNLLLQEDELKMNTRSMIGKVYGMFSFRSHIFFHLPGLFPCDKIKLNI